MFEAFRQPPTIWSHFRSRLSRPSREHRDLVLAQGKALGLLVGLLQSKGFLRADTVAAHLSVLSVVTSETSQEEADILALWSAIIRDIGASTADDLKS